MTTVRRKGFPAKAVLTLGVVTAIYALLFGLLLPSCSQRYRVLDYKPVNVFTNWTVVVPSHLPSVRRYEALGRYGCFEATLNKTQLSELLSANGILDTLGYQIGSMIATVDCHGKTLKTCQPAYAFPVSIDSTIVACQSGIVVGKQRTSQT